jgi:hypothetical protein
MEHFYCQTGSPIGGNSTYCGTVNTPTANVLVAGLLLSIVLPFAPAIAVLTALSGAFSAVSAKVDRSF